MIGSRIQEIRTQKGITQDQLSEKVGISPKYLSSIERGKENPIGKPDPVWSDFPICVRYILQEVGKKYSGGRHKTKWPLNSYQDVEPKRNIVDISHII